MEKEKIHLEYQLNGSSKHVIWNIISTSNGLETWFADQVNIKGKVATFKWNGEDEKKAFIVASRLNSYIRFRWEEDADTKYYFEIRMGTSDLTQSYHLEIVDFAEPDEQEELIELWDSQIETLCRANGM